MTGRRAWAIVVSGYTVPTPVPAARFERVRGLVESARTAGPAQHWPTVWLHPLMSKLALMLSALALAATMTGPDGAMAAAVKRRARVAAQPQPASRPRCTERAVGRPAELPRARPGGRRRARAALAAIARRGWYDARLGDRERYPLATIWDIVPLFESLDAIAIAAADAAPTGGRVAELRQPAPSAT